MAGAARRHAERFSWQRTADGLLVVYRARWPIARQRAGSRRPWADRDAPPTLADEVDPRPR